MLINYTGFLLIKLRIKFLIVALLLVFGITPIFAQLSGTKTIPGDYATISAAVADLNTQGVGSGGVIFNVAPSYTESITSPILLTATGTAPDPITFQKSGAGINPLVTRADAGTVSTSTLGGQGDAVIIIQGSDYVTFDGIDVATNDQGIEYGYYLRKASTDDGCKFVTIKNAVIDLTKGTSGYVAGIYSSNNDAASLPSSATGITVTSTGGRNENITITGGTIQDVFAGILLRGYNHTTSPYDFQDQNNVVGQNGAGNTIQNYAGNNASSAYGVYLIYQTSPNVSYNTISNAGGGGANATSTLYGIFMSSSNAGGDAVFNNNNITLGQGTTSGAQGIYISPVCSSATVNNNTFNYGTFASTTSSYMIYCSNGTQNINAIGNQTGGAITKTGAGSFYGFYDFGSPTGGLGVFQNNNFSNITLSGASTFYGIYFATSTSQAKTISGNTVSNITGGTNSVYGIYTNYDGPGTSIYLNTVTGLSGTGSAVYGYSVGGTSSSGTIECFRNDAYNISCTGTGAVYGIYHSGTTGSVCNSYRNNIYNILGNNASSLVYGMYISAGTTINAYNNFISEIKAPLANAAQAVNGIYVAGGTTVGLYYNTIYLNATSSGALFGSNGIYTSTTPTVDMRDNIVVNVSTPVGATGYTTAYRRSSTTLTSYASASNNNDFYAGIPGANNLIYTDGTNYDQTISDFKSRVSPRDAASFTENPPFMNVGSSPYNLHINTSIATQIESGGTTVSTPVAITDDFDGNTRNATTPDVGADEFAGIPADLTPPGIVYTPLGPTSSTSARTLTATISDASGVPTGGIGLPVLYWKINSGSWSAVTATYLSGSDYQFTLGSGVVLNDTVKYYICAQDNATPPNVGASPSGGAGGFSANPPAASIPPTNPSSYIIVDLPLAGSYTVGTTLFNNVTGRNITFVKSIQKVMKEVVVETKATEITREKGVEDKIPANEISATVNGIKQMVEVEQISWVPMENGKVYEGDLFVKRAENPSLQFPEGTDGVYLTITAAVNDLNLRGVSAATTFLLTDATYPTETFPITVNIINENIPTAVNTVTIKPNTGVTASVSGASASSQIFKILTSYITIDGSNSGGTSRDLTIENTSATSPQVLVIGSKGTTPITNVTVKNCNLTNGVNTSSAVLVSDGNSPGTAGWFNNITIQNNSIKKAYIANYNIAVVSAGNGSGLNINSNDINATGTDANRLVCVYVQGVDGATVADNNLGNIANTADASNITGIWFATATVNSFIQGNNILNMSGTLGAPRGIALSSGSATTNVWITGNTVNNLTTSSSGTTSGIYIFSTTAGVTVNQNDISNIKNTNTGGWGCNGIYLASTSTNANMAVYNNLVYDVASYGYASGGGVADNGYGMIVASGAGYEISFNSVYMTTSQTVDGRPAAMNITSGVTLAGAIDLRDNIFANIQTVGTNRYAIYCAAAANVFSSINYTDYYTTGPNLGFFGAAPVLDLAAWQTATGQDLNSISADPEFMDLTDLRPMYTSPVLGAGTPIAGITVDFLGVTRSATNPSMGAYEEGVTIPIPAGTYTVGLSEFLQKTGKKIYFEKRSRTVTKDLLANDSPIDINANNDEKNESINKSGKNDIQRFVTVTEEYTVMMENGKPFDQTFFRNNSTLGVYPTITSAIADLVLRGIAGPVTFLLVDSDYPSETYPLLITDIIGASETNTITFKPGPGVQANIPGNIAQPTSTFQLGGADYVIVDGSNTVGGTTKDLHITCPVAYPAFHYYGASNHNMIMNTTFDSKYTSTSSGTFLFGAAASGDSNYVENCSVTKSDTSAIKPGVGVYFFSSNTSIFNKIVGCDISDFNSYGIRPQGAPSTNNLIKGNHIYHTTPATASSVYGIYVSRQPGLVIEENYISNLQSTSASPFITGIVYLGSSGNPVDIYVRNNVVSISADVTQPLGTIRGIDYYAYAANSAEIYFNTIYIGGTNVTGGTTTGLSKRDAATLLKMYDNAVYITRSNSTGTGKHYGVYFSNTVIPFEMNNNDYFVDGNGGVFGYFGTADVLTLADWQTATSQDANSISENPVFISNLDYRPQDISPLLDAGVTIAGITTDILGDPRGTPPTIGAYENAVFVPINAPTYLIAIADTFTVDLSWQDNSNNEFGFVLERKDGDSLSVNPFNPIDTVGVDSVHYLDTGLNANTTYTYRVYGYNSSGNSGYSNLAQATTFIPVELTSFTAEIAERDVLIKWGTATETNNRGFDVERKLYGEWEKLGFIEGKGSTTEKSDYSFIDKFTYTSYKGEITYRLKQIDFAGTYSYSPEVEINADFTPKEYTLYQNYPNPFNPATTIKFSMPFESKVQIAVYNILGELVDVVVDELKEAGFHNYLWNASNLASGIYIYRIDAKAVNGSKSYSSVKKMILMK